MKEKSAEQKCAHIPCQCSPETVSKYCSPQCEKAFEQTDCSCGHAECRAKA